MPAAEPSQPRSHASRPGLSVVRREHRGAGAVAEQDGGGAVVGIDDAAQRLGADDQHVLVARRAPSTRRPRARRRSPRTRRRRSNEPQRSPSASPTNAPVWGIGCSGVAVATIMRSMSGATSPARLIASRGGCGAERRGRLVRARDRGARECRCARRSTASFVSTRASRSALVTRAVGDRGAPADDAWRPSRLTRRAATRRLGPRAGVRPGARAFPSACRRTGCAPARSCPVLRARRRRRRRRPSSPSSTSSGRNTPTPGATIMRSGTASSLAVQGR